MLQSLYGYKWQFMMFLKPIQVTLIIKRNLFPYLLITCNCKFNSIKYCIELSHNQWRIWLTFLETTKWGVNIMAKLSAVILLTGSDETLWSKFRMSSRSRAFSDGSRWLSSCRHSICFLSLFISANNQMISYRLTTVEPKRISTSKYEIKQKCSPKMFQLELEILVLFPEMRSIIDPIQSNTKDWSLFWVTSILIQWISQRTRFHSGLKFLRSFPGNWSYCFISKNSVHFKSHLPNCKTSYKSSILHSHIYSNE